MCFCRCGTISIRSLMTRSRPCLLKSGFTSPFASTKNIGNHFLFMSWKGGPVAVPSPKRVPLGTAPCVMPASLPHFMHMVVGGSGREMFFTSSRFSAKETWTTCLSLWPHLGQQRRTYRPHIAMAGLLGGDSAEGQGKFLSTAFYRKSRATFPAQLLVTLLPRHHVEEQKISNTLSHSPTRHQRN